MTIPLRIVALTALTMLAFAGNSLLCRMALRDTGIDPAAFTALRLLSGAAMLWLLARIGGGTGTGGSWRSALALFAYAAGFSFAYVSLSAGTGALLLFAAVQATMILTAWRRGEKLSRRQGLGLLLAIAGLVALVAPGVAAPSWRGSLLMLAAGIAWGIYSLRGRGVANPLAATAGNFLRSLPFALLLCLIFLPRLRYDSLGALYAVLSGALASGLGYVLWYAALRGLDAASAATVQLSVPAIAAAGGVLLLGETLTLRLLLASATILGGIALVLRKSDAA